MCSYYSCVTTKNWCLPSHSFKVFHVHTTKSKTTFQFSLKFYLVGRIALVLIRTLTKSFIYRFSWFLHRVGRLVFIVDHIFAFFF